MKLYENGKSRTDIAREYDITPSVLRRWIKNYQETGSFAAKDNRTGEENEIANGIISLFLNLIIMFIGSITFEFMEHWAI